MDRERFDALARFLGSAGSRRAMLGGLVGMSVVGGGAAFAAKKGKKGKKDKNKNRPCYGTKTCEFSGEGAQDLDGCDFSGTDLFFDSNCGGCSLRGADLSDAALDFANLQGAMLRDANLSGSDLFGADLSGASLRGACLFDADLEDAKVDGASLEGAFFCNTTLPDGSVANDDCDRDLRCCKHLVD